MHEFRVAPEDFIRYHQPDVPFALAVGLLGM
jgi:hypothetical protein